MNQAPDPPAPAGALLQRWLARPWFFALWCVVAAFGAYGCMYGFRKPFTAGSYLGTDLGPKLKAWLVTAQVVGYTLSKFIGIKVIAEMTPARRATALLGLIGAALASLLLFAFVPAPYNAACLFLNGVPLGLVFGLVLGFLEGRQLTELFIAGLCASFILADGAAKTIGGWLLQAGIPERWMPFAAGLLFTGPMLLFAWMLRQIPAPTRLDIAARSERAPMSHRDRLAMLVRHGPGLGFIILAYLLITILRSVRADFAAEIWAGLGFAGEPDVFTHSEIWVTLGVIAASGSLVLLRDNRRAFHCALGLSIAGLALAALALAAQRAGALPPFPFIVLLGLGLYVPYVAIHTTVFERLLALTRERGNIGFLMYMADSIGYLGYSAVMIARSVLPESPNFLRLFLNGSSWLVVGALLAMVAALGVFILETRRRILRP